MLGRQVKVVNWVGVLAQLRRVDAEHMGRLVLVERSEPAWPGPAGGDPLPVWHIYVLGEALQLEGDTWREANVAQICLQPLCRLPEVIAEAAIVAQAERDFEAALSELSRFLARHPVDDAHLDESLEQAARMALGPRQWPEVPVRSY